MKPTWTSLNLASDLPEETARQLLISALEAREKAYAPYSSFFVGAAVLTEDDKVFTGSNVENSSFGATVCAERIAVFKAVNAGCRSIKALAIVADYTTPVPPCGVCRQVVAEFGSDVVVLMSNTTGEVAVKSLRELFPCPFEFGKR